VAKLKDLKVVIGLSKKGLTKLNADLRRTKASFKRNFGEIQGMVRTTGRAMTAGLTAPLGLMAVQAVKAFDQQQKAIAQVEAGLKSTGAQVGYTSKQLQQMASNLQSKTLFGDEVILKDATAQLLTFTNIAGDNFARTQAVALDLATRLDGDLKSASIQLGKALNDPVSNLTALSRAGIQFSAEQKEVIKSLAETGRLAEAQTIILDELEKQYGGSAEAAAQAGTGPFKQLQNTIGDLSEEFGKLIADVFVPLIPKITAVVASVRNMSTGMKRSIVMIAGLLGAAGPLALAFSALMPIIAALTGPIGLIITAVAALGTAIIYFRKEIAKPLAAVANFFIDIYNEVAFVRAVIAVLSGTVQTAFRLMYLAVETFFKGLKTVGEAIISLIVERDFDKARSILTNGFQDIGTAAFDEALEIGKDFGEGIEAGVRNRLERVDAKSISDALDFSNLLDFGGPGGALEIPIVPKMQQMAARTAATVTPGLLLSSEAAAQTTSAVSRMNDMVAVSVDLAGQASNAFVGLGEALAGMATGTMNVGQFMASVLTSLADLLGQIGQQFIAAGIAAAQFYANLIANPFAAVAAGVALVAASGIIKALGSKLANNEVPQMAEGGLFTGASLAMVGEGPGTSAINPEVVAPLDKLQNMMGGGNVTVTGKIRGSDILLSNERSLLDRNRTRGF
jgi:hypothetical protein